MTTPMISLLPKGEWQKPASHNVSADGLALNLTLEDLDPAGTVTRTHLSFHYKGPIGTSMGSSYAKDAEAIGRDRLASLFVTAAGALFDSATPAVQRRMGKLIRGEELAETGS